MLGRIATGGIIVFWLLMMGLLVHREILPDLELGLNPEETPRYSQMGAQKEYPYTEKVGIYLGNRRLGQSVTTVSRDKRRDDDLNIRNETDINLALGTAIPFLSKLPGVDTHVTFTARVVDGKLSDFHTDIDVGDGTMVADIEGFVVGKQMILTIKQGDGPPRNETIPFDPRQMIATDMMPAFAPSKLRVGATWTIQSLDIKAMGIRKARATVRSREEVEIGGRKRDVFVVEIPYGSGHGEVATVYVSPEGDVLMQKFLGFRMEREDLDSVKDEDKQ